MMIDFDARTILEILGLAGVIIRELYNRGKVDSGVMTKTEFEKLFEKHTEVSKAACDQRHKDDRESCVQRHDSNAAVIDDLRSETNAELDRRAEAKIVNDLRDETRAGLNRTADAKVVDRLEITVGTHGELIAGMTARMDGLAEGMVRIEQGIDGNNKLLNRLLAKNNQDS